MTRFLLTSRQILHSPSPDLPLHQSLQWPHPLLKFDMGKVFNLLETGDLQSGINQSELPQKLLVRSTNGNWKKYEFQVGFGISDQQSLIKMKYEAPKICSTSNNLVGSFLQLSNMFEIIVMHSFVLAFLQVVTIKSPIITQNYTLFPVAI